jgi:dimethylamine corrinoid protein
VDQLISVLLDGDQDQAVAEAKKLLKASFTLEDIINDGIEASMRQLDAKCTAEHFNLLEIMLCGRAVIAVMKELYPLDNSKYQTKGTVVIGALEGDIHDLGKNIVKMVLVATGYRVIDCGKDCSVGTIIETAARENAFAIGISALLTTIIPQLRQMRAKMDRMKLVNIKLLAGGGALQQATAESLNVDFIGQTVFEGIHYLEHSTGANR